MNSIFLPSKWKQNILTVFWHFEWLFENIQTFSPQQDPWLMLHCFLLQSLSLTSPLETASENPPFERPLSGRLDHRCLSFLERDGMTYPVQLYAKRMGQGQVVGLRGGWGGGWGQYLLTGDLRVMRNVMCNPVSTWGPHSHLKLSPLTFNVHCVCVVMGSTPQSFLNTHWLHLWKLNLVWAKSVTFILLGWQAECGEY